MIPNFQFYQHVICTFADDIKKADMVSEINNKGLLDEIRYPGISGKIKQNLRYIFAG